MRIVQVHHQIFDETSGNVTGFQHVADVEVKADEASINAALEYAYRWTNNIDGSWSNKDLTPNSDLNPLVQVLVPLHEHNGRKLGLRSSMIGDKFVIYDLINFDVDHFKLNNAKEYVVATFGFEEIK